MYDVYVWCVYACGHSCMQTTSNAISEIEFFARKCFDGARIKARKRSDAFSLYVQMISVLFSSKTRAFFDPLKISIGNIRAR